MIARALRIALMGGILCLVAACGGGDGGTSSSGGGSGGGGGGQTGPVNNAATITVDGGPAALNTGPNGYEQFDVAYVSVTICAPGSTTNCQTIDHVQVDTGSVGLRILQSVITPNLLSALPVETDASGNPVGECYGYVDGYVFGSVRTADFSIAGEKVASMPFQVAGDTGVFTTPPASCSNGGGINQNTVQALGANGVLGIGVSATDCQTYCQTAGGYAAAIYYDCPAGGCSGIITRAAYTAAPFQQLPNPVAAFASDNNGSILVLPSVPSTGQATLTGTLYFGIGTQSDNALGAATVLPVSPSSAPYGPGLLTAVYNGLALNNSFIDSGSNSYFFVDNTLAACAGVEFTGYYCPSSPVTLTATLQGATGSATATPSFPLYNAQTLLSTTFSALPGIGANPDELSSLNAYPNSFDFGLPFFFGRSVYTAIEGRAAGGVNGPYVAF
jgi:hypothetical protein